MLAVFASSRAGDFSDVRQTLLGAGLECSVNDCVDWSNLLPRLAQVDADLLVFAIDDASPADWNTLREAQQLFATRTFAIGELGGEFGDLAREAGVIRFLNRANLRAELDMAIESMTEARVTPRPRGSLISVFAPTPGSGGATLSANLAAALCGLSKRPVALVELAREFGDLALMLDANPEHSVEDVCHRWERLDAANLEDCAFSHRSGLRLLINAQEPSGNRYLHRDSVRRLAILSRVTFGTTVFAVDASLGEAGLEALRLSDCVVVVVRPDVPCVRRAKSTLVALEQQGIRSSRLRLVVNRWGQRGQLSLRDVETALGLKVVQAIPDAPATVNKAVNHGLLVQEVSRLATIHRRLYALAKTIQATPVAV